MSDILLTIAVPTYNRAHLLNDCLTILAQEFGGSPKVEVLVSNNASTDNTAAIVEAHRERNFPGLRYFENSSNLGSDHNITQCFREAQGKYVWVFSDDDLLLPTYGKQILDLLQSDNWGLIHLKSLWYDGANVPKPMPVALQHQVYPQGLDFIQQIHYWVTFITGNIINKSLLADAVLTYSFNGTNLTQLGWTLPVAFTRHPNLLITTPVLACRANNTGGYKLFKTFATDFNAVMAKLVAGNTMPASARRIINRNLIANFFPDFIRANRAAFNQEPILSTLYREFKNYKKFWSDLLPLYYVETAKSQSVLLKSKLKRLIAKSLYKILKTQEYQQLILSDRSQFRQLGSNPGLPTQMLIKNPQYISIGKNFTALYNLRIEAWDTYEEQKFEPSILIGDDVNMNSDCHIGCINRVSIGNNVLIASKVYISDHSHGKIQEEELLLPPVKRKLYSRGPVLIEDNVWIGEGVCIMPGVTIGRSSIIGANSVVTKDVPPNTIVAGIPAKVIKSFATLAYNQLTQE